MDNRWISWALMASIVSSLISIAVSSIFFGLAILLWVVACLRSRKIQLGAPPFSNYLLALSLAILISIAFSSDIFGSALYLKKLLKFLYVFLIFTYLRRPQIEATLKGIFLVLAASALYGILQYYGLKEVNLLNRISGFMGHWMTFSGQLMMGSVALTAYVLLDRAASSGNPHQPRRPGWAVWVGQVGLLAVILFALGLTLTRNAWLGALVGLLIVVAVRRLSWTAVALAAVVLVFLLLPASFQQRLYSSFDFKDTTTRVRVELLRTGMNMIWAHPWTGVGPRMVPRLYEQFRTSREFPDWIYQHLHNDAVQIAAEIGLIGLLAWVALWVKILCDLVKLAWREKKRRSLQFCLAVTGISVLAAFLASGFFEYNFGDSEKLILLFFFVTAPYVSDQPWEETP